jgi:hypothetical protein
MTNFEKPLHEFTVKELLDRVNQWDPKFGALAYYELHRRLSVENASSSRRFAHWSLAISVVAILITIGIGGMQIYLASVQATPVFQSIAKNDKDSLNYCLQNVDSFWSQPDGATTTCKSILSRRGYLLNKQLDAMQLLQSLGLFSLLSTTSKSRQ